MDAQGVVRVVDFGVLSVTAGDGVGGDRVLEASFDDFDLDPSSGLCITLDRLDMSLRALEDDSGMTIGASRFGEVDGERFFAMGFVLSIRGVWERGVLCGLFSFLSPGALLDRSCTGSRPGIVAFQLSD